MGTTTHRPNCREQRLVRRCGKCVHSGEHFRITGGTHMHCNHPVESVRDTPPYGTGWGTLRKWTDSCSEFAPLDAPNTERSGSAAMDDK